MTLLGDDRSRRWWKKWKVTDKSWRKCVTGTWPWVLCLPLWLLLPFLFLGCHEVSFPYLCLSAMLLSCHKPKSKGTNDCEQKPQTKINLSFLSCFSVVFCFKDRKLTNTVTYGTLHHYYEGKFVSKCSLSDSMFFLPLQNAALEGEFLWRISSLWYYSWQQKVGKSKVTHNMKMFYQIMEINPIDYFAIL